MLISKTPNDLVICYAISGCVNKVDGSWVYSWSKHKLCTHPIGMELSRLCFYGFGKSWSIFGPLCNQMGVNCNTFGCWCDVIHIYLWTPVSHVCFRFVCWYLWGLTLPLLHHRSHEVTFWDIQYWIDTLAVFLKL